MMIEKTIRLAKLVGIDRAIFYVILYRGWGVFSGVITLFFITRYLTPEQQGYYYTFSSVLAIQTIFELGLGTIITQFISHEMTKLKYADGVVSGCQLSLSKFNSIVRLSVLWYFVLSVVLLFVLIIAGLIFFKSSDSGVAWKLPWFFLSVAASINILLTPFFSISEGCGLVAHVAKLRFTQTVAAGFFVWLVLFCGFDLFALSVVPIVSFLFGSVWVKKHLLKVIRSAFDSFKENKDHAVSWKQDIFPMQWRVAVSWICGYFIFQLLNPVAFKLYGPAFAGKFGITLNVVNLLMNVSLSWITTKIPKFGYLIATDRIEELDKIFRKTVVQSLLFLIFLGVMFSLSIEILDVLEFSMPKRFLGMFDFFVLFFTYLGNHIIACQATYVRCHKIEIYLSNAILTALVIVVAYIFLYFYKFDASWMIYSYFLVIWTIGVPHSFYIFKNFKFNKLRFTSNSQ